MLEAMEVVCCVLEAVEGVLYLLEMLDGVRCVLPRMPEAVEGVHYVLEVLEVMCCALELLEIVFEALEVLEAARCVLLCMLEAVDSVCCVLRAGCREGCALLLEVPEVMRGMFLYAGGRGPRTLCAGAAGGDAPHVIGAECHALCAGGSEGRAGS